MSELLITPARKEDLAAVLAVDEQSFPPGKGYNALMLRQFFDAVPEFFLVARRPAVCGYAIAMAGAKPRSAWVAVVAVLPAMRKDGVAGALCSALFEALMRARIEQIYFTVRPDNAAVIRLAERWGFARAGEEPDYFGPGERRVLLQWNRPVS
jgi:ribosomal protein S18 acetylase RimI-like enzyme